MPTAVTPLHLEPLRTACSNCNLRELCLPVGLSAGDMERLDGLISQRRAVPRGESLFRAGEHFHALYAVRTGFFKTGLTAEDGRAQVTGFQMAGELLGLDGIGSGHHTVNAEALEDSQVCVLPFSDLENLAREFGALQTQLHRIMSREIVRDHGVMLLLGSMRAEERVAAFLLNLTQRLQARGFSASELVLRMTREEIGSYLGLKLETVSRTFSKFQEDGVLDVKQRQITVRKPEVLQRMVSAAAC
jgi:CRP/FNR family transcriptional regulator, anaerobic regulatory protein